MAMRTEPDYRDKFNAISGQTLYPRLPAKEQAFIRQQAISHRFTLQELRQIAEIAVDLTMWRHSGIESIWPPGSHSGGDRAGKQQLLQQLKRQWNDLKAAPNVYPETPPIESGPRAEPVIRSKDQLGLGACPVASPRTRCCNLLTLDAVDNCGYGCSYCSIQSFFTGQRVYFDPRFAEKLKQIPIDPEQIYHIGTGQSSDSLMWGNSNGVLEALIDFARRHSNVILELKTKSANTGYLQRTDLPPNLICTWSLNPQPVIEHEEQGTAALDKRIDAALRLADRGSIVGFHFHPMIHYQGWERDYTALFERLQRLFGTEQVAMVSLGTLTFIKPVIRRIRQRGGLSQILKLPLEEADGKLSYPDPIKLQLFRTAYQSFSPEWQREVFFYLCMENQRLWQPVFGHDYPTNSAFERAMKDSYLNKIHGRTC